MRVLQRCFLGFEGGITPAALSLVELLENCFQIMTLLNNFPNRFSIIFSTLQGGEHVGDFVVDWAIMSRDLCGKGVSVRAPALK